MTRTLKPYLMSGLLYALVFTGCASTSPKIPMTGVERVRPWSFEATSNDSAPRTAFVSKGVYLTGLKHDGSYAPGTWVRLMPGDSWPPEEPRPTLIIARVVERQKATARLEMLAYQPGFRDTDLSFEAYLPDVNTASPAQMLHAMTKRLTFAAQDIQKGAKTVHIPLTQVELIQGTEIYGAFDVRDVSPQTRLAAQNRALLTVDATGNGMTQLQVAAGEMPQMPAFVLLDAPPIPAFQIDIKIATLPENMERSVVQTMKDIIDTGLPGSEHIRLTTTAAADTAQVWAELGQACTDTLEVRLFHDDAGLIMLDHGLRVHAYPWRVVLDDADADLAAAAVLASAYQMLGYQASAAWVLEQAWQNSQTSERRAALAPALALAYHEMERDDWALELALELQGYARDASKKTKSVLLTAAASVYAIIGRLEEFAPNFASVQSSSLSTPWLRVLAHVQLSSFEQPGMKEQFAATHQKLVREKAWTEQDEMNSCVQRIDDDEEACSQGVSIASTPFSQTWFETYEALNHATPEDLLIRAEAVDRIGAPELASRIWLELLQSGMTPETAFSVWQNAAAYTRKSQQTRRWLYLMANLIRFLESHPMPIEPEIFAEAVSGWRAMDYRAELAALCRLRANSAAPQEARELRQFAAELYLSIGDYENAAAVMTEINTEQPR